MSASASTLTKTIGFYEASIGKKAVVAVTGCIMVLYVIGHLFGNLQIYLPPGEDGVYPIDHYAEFLHGLGKILWMIRGVLLLTVVLHVTAALQLWLYNRSARPQNYSKQGWREADWASRHMVLTGLFMAGFIVYHLLDLTTGHAHVGGFEELQVHHNVVASFQNPVPSITYIVIMALLGFHLSHGIWSMFQSVGWNHPRYMPVLKWLALVGAIVIVLGNISIPLSVMLGIVS